MHGELFATPAPSYEHQQLVEVLAERLWPYVSAHRLGRLQFPRSIVRFARHSEVEPDLMVRPTPLWRLTSWADAPRPILVVEVLSGTTRRRDRIEKRRLYVEEGIPEYWIVDRADRLIQVVRPGEDDTEVSTHLVWHPARVPEPFTLDVPDTSALRSDAEPVRPELRGA